MTEKSIKLASNLLRDAAVHYSNHGCNDFDFPFNWTNKEKQQFVQEFHIWDKTQDEYDPKRPELPDFAVMEFLAHLLESS